ncbi:hypothetical protein [Salinicola sp. DM10]|uniref:hypothetical protein n=1 Tax=Salinicola sp. DM10 TaxID=2815721 RepID=UPI001A8E7AB9|nr:hypothetical protein [Salinicola sp. DM10]MCE3025772.1 hypothetical protein [Salinicola sp. DM10]
MDDTEAYWQLAERNDELEREKAALVIAMVRQEEEIERLQHHARDLEWQVKNIRQAIAD